MIIVIIIITIVIIIAIVIMIIVIIIIIIVIVIIMITGDFPLACARLVLAFDSYDRNKKYSAPRTPGTRVSRTPTWYAAPTSRPAALEVLNAIRGSGDSRDRRVMQRL